MLVVLLVLAVLGFFAFNAVSSNEQTTSVEQSVTASNSPSPAIPYFTPIASAQTTAGTAPTLAVVAPSWQSYRNDPIGVTFRYPPDWKAVEDADKNGVTLFPAGQDPSLPGPNILMRFSALSRYSGSPSPAPNQSQSQAITIAGVAGHWSEDTGNPVPTASYNVELPYRNGVFFISATKGPVVNLVPQEQEIVKTLTLKP